MFTLSLLERNTGLKGRIYLTFHLVPSCFIRIFFFTLTMTISYIGNKKDHHMSGMKQRSVTEVITELWAGIVGAKMSQHLTLEEEVMEGLAGCVGVHWMEMSREIISGRRTTWVETV